MPGIPNELPVKRPFVSCDMPWTTEIKLVNVRRPLNDIVACL